MKTLKFQKIYLSESYKDEQSVTRIDKKTMNLFECLIHGNVDIFIGEMSFHNFARSRSFAFQLAERKSRQQQQQPLNILLDAV